MFLLYYYEDGGKVIISQECTNVPKPECSNLPREECKQYDVFTEVSAFLTWIDDTVLAHGGMSSCDFYLAAYPASPPPTSHSILLTGGYDASGFTSSELYPPVPRCTAPPLPDARYNHNTFTTDTSLIATCGGQVSTGRTSTCLGGCLGLLGGGDI